jgi:hypothetical protein
MRYAALFDACEVPEALCRIAELCADQLQVLVAGEIEPIGGHVEKPGLAVQVGGQLLADWAFLEPPDHVDRVGTTPPGEFMGGSVEDADEERCAFDVVG